MTSGAALIGRPVRIGWRAARAAFAVTSGYLGVLTVAASRAEKARRHRQKVGGPAPAPALRIAVLVPAHNEEQLIAATVSSLSSLDYPADLYEVHIVADNCTDATAEVARAASVDAAATVIVHERDDLADPGKGPALRWLTGRVLARCPFDALAFVDADTTVDPAFLSSAERVVAAGADVVQGHYAVRDESDGGVVAFRAAAFAGRTFLRPAGRQAIGGSAGLYGNGMVFRTSVLERRQWSNHLVEDVELHLQLLLDGVLVAFAPDARVAAEMPATLEASATQHQRWERGRLEMARRFAPRLARHAVVGGPSGRVAYVDALLDQLVPPFSVVAASGVAWWSTSVVRFVVRPGRARLIDVVAATAVVATQAGFVFGALRLVDAPPAVYRSLLQAPRMVAWKLRLWGGVITRRDVAWQRTARN